MSPVAASRSERQAVESLLGDRCEALILLGPQAPAARLAELAALLPVVSIARRLRLAIPGVQVIRTADDEGARQAVDHLLVLGHRDIAHIDGGKAPGAADRRRGYRTAMNRHGLADSIRILPGGLTAEDGATAADTLLATAPLPSAVLAFNDACSTGALNTFFRARVSVPDETSVAGFADSRLARLPHVDLTTIAQDISRKAELAVPHAAKRLETNGTPAGQDIVAPHLVIRGTTATARWGKPTPQLEPRCRHDRPQSRRVTTSSRPAKRRGPRPGV